MKIYIPAEGAGDAGILGEDDVRLSWHTTSVTIDLRVAPAAPAAAAAQWRRLHVPELNGEIESATLRRRSGKVIVTLVKKDAATAWFDLRKKK